MLAEDKTFTIAPGQVRPIKLVLEYKNGMEQQNDGSVCSDVKMVLKIGTNKGQDQTLTINLRCRKQSESFLFTFVDHDGSVQPIKKSSAKRKFLPQQKDEISWVSTTRRRMW